MGLQKEVVWQFLTCPCTPALLETQAQVHHLLHFQTLVKRASTGSLVLCNAASLMDGSHWKGSCLKSLWSIKNPLRNHWWFEQMCAHTLRCCARPCVGRTLALQFSMCRRHKAMGKSAGHIVYNLFFLVLSSDK